MGLINKIFGKTEVQEPQQPSLWKKLTSMDQIDVIKDLSKDKKVIIFKHSTRCGISGMVWRQFQSKVKEDEEILFFYVDILASRDVSDALIHEFQVIHQSPQVIILKDEKVISHASHNSINALEI
ncbi:MAG: bacillithiol system redox-active protein YtxJ [Psychroflexus sp.]|nr:bacillithiol system redox-active protein YtxJ [Psychroflexus sp.]MDN6316458.1 bacillithiol system redox-active protein YtxJ [Lactococcus lactis]